MKRFLFFALALLVLPAQSAELRNGSVVAVGPTNFGSPSGGSDAYAFNLSPALPAYVTGACYRFKADVANTGAATLNINSLGAKAIKKAAGGVTTDLADNDIRAGQVVMVCYDDTNMQMQSTSGNAASGMATATHEYYFRAGACDSVGNFFYSADAAPSNGASPTIGCNLAMSTPYWVFSASAKQTLISRMIFPANLTGNISAVIYASAGVTNTNVAVHSIETACLPTGYNWGVAPTYTATTPSTAAWTQDADELQSFTFSALTLPSPCNPGDIFAVRWGRDGAHASDSDTNVSTAVGIKLQWAVSQ